MNSINKHRRSARPPLLWPPIEELAALLDGEIHLYTAWLEGDQNPGDEAWSLLSEEERERAARFKFERHRNRFVRGRALLRALLAWHLAKDAAELILETGRFGKPALPANSAQLQFNMAHSDDLLLIGVTRGPKLGVDVERVRTLDDFDELVKRFFSPSENTVFQNLHANEKPEAFFNLWTRKEAFLKATGEGITFSLNKIEVSFLPGEPARFVRLPAESPEQDSAGPWTLHQMKPAQGYVAAVAVRAHGTGPARFEFSVPAIEDFLGRTCAEHPVLP